MDENIGNCPLCQAIHTVEGKRKFYNTPLMENDKFVVLPSIGPAVLGHVMIVSKEHSYNLASLDFNSFHDFINIIESIKQKYPFYRDNLLEIEHGATRINNAGGCIIHTHIHLVPNMGKYDLFTDLTLQNIFKDWLDLKSQEAPYFAVKDDSKSLKVYNAINLPTQYLRRILFRFKGVDDWDWFTNPNYDLVIKTINLWDAT